MDFFSMLFGKATDPSGSDTEALEMLIDESGVFENDGLTLVEKVRQLINIAKNGVTKNFLKSSDGFILKDVNGIYLMPKESD